MLCGCDRSIFEEVNCCEENDLWQAFGGDAGGAVLRGGAGDGVCG